MKSYGLSIDPGVENGACMFTFGDDGMKVIKLWQFDGGAENLGKWADHTMLRLTSSGVAEVYGTPVHLVVERFTPRPHETFALTRKSVEPLRGEGVLIGRGLGPAIQWREPSQQYFMGGDDLDEKKKLSREFLKTHGMYVTGKNEHFQRPNADDAISATLHAVSYLRSIKHMPTMHQLFKGEI